MYIMSPVNFILNVLDEVTAVMPASARAGTGQSDQGQHEFTIEEGKQSGHLKAMCINAYHSSDEG